MTVHSRSDQESRLPSFPFGGPEENDDGGEEAAYIRICGGPPLTYEDFYAGKFEYLSRYSYSSVIY